MNARNVIVTCHGYADADAVASTLAITELVNSYRKNVNFYLQTFDNTGKIAYDELAAPLHHYNLTEKNLEKNIKTNTLLIVLDTTDGNRLQFKKSILDKFDVSNRLVIDHHRVSSEPLEAEPQSVLLDTNISSSAELVTNLIQARVNGAAKDVAD
jgi:c-di-AMP phosphodiesterase-like protein